MDPFSDPDYLAGRVAQEARRLEEARKFFEIAATKGNVAALQELLNVCFDLGDKNGVRKYMATLESLAQESATAAYAASLAQMYGPYLKYFDMAVVEDKRKAYLIRAAELGLPWAQVDLASHFAWGLNNFPQDSGQYEKWGTVASKSQPLDAARLASEVAESKSQPVPEWALAVLKNESSA